MSHQMPFFSCGSNTFSTFITAIKKDDAKYVKENMNKFQFQAESRGNDVDEKIFEGFYPIHYAALLYQQQCLDLLIPQSGNFVTKYESVVECSHMKKCFQLPAGQDIINLLLVNENYGMAGEYLKRFEFQNEDELGNSHLMLLAYFPMTNRMSDFMQNSVIMREFPLRNEVCYLQIVFRFKRLQHLVQLLEYLKRKPDQIEHFYVQMTHCFKDKTMYDVLESKLDYVQWETSLDDTLVLFKFWRRVIPQAIKFLQKRVQQYGGHLGEFFQHQQYNIEHKQSELTLDEMIQLLNEKQEEQSQQIFEEVIENEDIFLKQQKESDVVEQIK